MRGFKSSYLLAVALGLVLAGCGVAPGLADPGGGAAPPATLPATPGVVPTVILTESPFTGYLAPDFTVPDLDGRPVKLSDLRGHPVWLLGNPVRPAA